MLAAIDAGSNTLRLLIGEADGNSITPYIYHRKITRLAGGFTMTAGLSHVSRERTLSALKEFASLCLDQGVTKIRAVGTAAFRKAINGQDFADEIKSYTGIDLDIISGTEEAELMASGVLSVLSPRPEASLIVDIGGGSTEFVLCQSKRVLWQTSFPLGVVALTEEGDSQDKTNLIDQTITLLFEEVRDRLNSLAIPLPSLQLVGTAGTVTTLAALDMQMTDYDWKRVNNYTIDYNRINKWHAILTPLTIASREDLPGMEQGRGDLIMAGIEIILSVMQKLACDSLIVSDFGLLEGTLLKLCEVGKT